MATTPINKDDFVSDKVLPTLYIALGGTGMEMALRLRRRILNSFWGGSKPVRISSLAEFPVAQFLHIDLDQGANRESDKAARTDLLADAVAFSDEERIVEGFDMARYINSSESLSMYPHIQNWFPMSPDEVTKLKIDPTKGAGQIRAISRLYFYDKAATIKARIRQKLEYLKNSTSNKAALEHLGLDVYPRLRIVVLSSSAGGTGAGAFLDAGYLSRWVGEQVGLPIKVDLIMMLASGYAKYGKRVEANTYAALMELETCVTENIPYVAGWEPGERIEVARKPYDDIYFVDTANVNSESTANHSDVHDMVASALFEDFSLAAFADRKRQVEVNQQQYKLAPFQAPMSVRFGDTKMAFAKSYSAIGQAVIDTQVEAKKSIQLYRQSNAMLRAFFGVAEGQTVGANQPTEQERDNFMQESLFTKRFTFTNFPDLAAKIEYKHVEGQFWDYMLTDELLKDTNNVSIVARLENTVNDTFEQIRTQVGRGEWQAKVQESIKQLERDVKKTVESGTITSESRIEERRKQLLQSIQADDQLPKRLFARLDDKERGGLDYTISLAEFIKDRIDNEATGYAKELGVNAKRFMELSDSLGVAELDKLYGNLRQTSGLFASKSQGDTVLSQIKEAVFGYLAYYCRAVASVQAAALLSEVSLWLGRKHGVDANGDAIWTGFVGQLIQGRQSVKALITELDVEIANIEQSTKTKSATYILLEAELAEPPVVTGMQAREWADEAFTEFGGSKTLFTMLRDKDSKAKLISALRNKCVSHMAVENPNATKNPLITTLQAMSVAARGKLFRDTLSLAMPWVNAKLSGNWSVDPNQYTCLIGVQDKPLFEELFGAELRQALPANAKLTAGRLWIDESGVPGRMVVYSELSGMPISSLNLLKDTWGMSYKQVSKEIPCHTHRNRGWFKHPVERTALEMNRMADDFALYLQAIVHGVLRLRKRDDGSIVYQVDLKRGDFRSIGSERTVRLEGLDEGIERTAITNQLSIRQDGIKTAAQWAGLSALYGYFMTDVYPSLETVNDLGKDVYIRGFANAIADSLAKDAEQKSKQLGIDSFEKTIARLDDRLTEWTTVLEGSISDAYDSEVRDNHRDKRCLKSEFFTEGWLEKTIGLVSAPDNVAPSVSTGAMLGSPPPPPNAGLPLDAGVQYFTSVSGQTYGPYSFAQMQQFSVAGNISATSLVWHAGAAWMPAAQMPALMALFNAAPTGFAPPPPPPPAP